MRELIGILRERDLLESVIDYPQEDLCSSVWKKDGDTYRVKPDVEKKIMNVLSEYPEFDLTKIKPIHIIGSLGTNQYANGADLDVHLVVEDPSVLPDSRSAEDWRKDIFKFYKDNREKLDAYVGEHPIEVYLQMNPAQELLSDALYDLDTHKWLKGPKLVPEDYDPYEVFSDVANEISDVVGDTDKLFGELKRDVIDYDIINKAIQKLDGDARKKLLERLRGKVDEIEKDIDSMMKNMKGWLEMRKKASAPTTEEQAKSDIDLVKNWVSKGALFKFISRYQYMQIISRLEKMMKDHKISDEEIDRIQAMLGVTSESIIEGDMPKEAVDELVKFFSEIKNKIWNNVPISDDEKIFLRAVADENSGIYFFVNKGQQTLFRDRDFYSVYRFWAERKRNQRKQDNRRIVFGVRIENANRAVTLAEGQGNDADLVKKYGFGTAAWQRAMLNRIMDKLKNKEPLNGSDKAFIEVQIEHNKRLMDELKSLGYEEGKFNVN